MSDALWHAVSTRDAHADGLFVYAVRSTGIYCRPSCASRKPRRDRVEFFPAPGMAASRGYRPCRRCRPDDPATGSPVLERVRRACVAVARHPEAPWTATKVARAGGTTVVQIQRAFRSLLGLAPRDYVAACRRRRFLDHLRNGNGVTGAMYDAGYGSPSRLYGAIRLPGMQPATYGRGGLGAAIDWTTIETPLGLVLVAATSKGLCFVEVGQSVNALVEALRNEFPAATIAPGPTASLGPLAEAARAVALAKDVSRDLPVDIRGTAFQWRVWRALTSIPRGETRTYSDLARAISSPASVRAVARACATNPIALVVPCHRVIGTDGKLHGYRWGLDVKRTLLDTERGSGVRKGSEVRRLVRGSKEGSGVRR
jgi:AraC family transcriptional regulator, regulatory protein of adaptative response / methylated-DNA-[protein]-cysteine methyltransferase